MPSKIIFSACDTGSANALAPVLAGLSSDYLLFAQKDAARVFARWNLPCQPVGPIGWEEVSEIGSTLLSPVQAEKIVTGTSWGPSIDKAFTLAARRRGIPCASIVEHWDLYMERFSVVKAGHIVERGSFIPDRIWVSDEVARREAVSAGLQDSRIEVVGQPHLERQLQKFREREINPSPGRVVFISERVSEDFAAGSPLFRGFDEFLALDQLIDLIDLSVSTLTIKLHPQETAGKFDHLVRARASIEVIKETDNLELIASAGKLVGMFSMLLLEAALVRNDVISFLPNGDPSIFVGNRLEATTPATTKAALKALLAKPACRTSRGDSKITAFGRRFAGSAARMTEAIKRLGH